MNQYVKKFIRALVLTAVIGVSSVASQAFAATLSLSPATGVYTAGQVFTASVIVNTAGQAINAAQGTVSFKPTELQVIGVAKGSVFGLWTADPTFSNAAGTVTFSGGTPSGYTGAGGQVLAISFKALAAGSPKVNFTDGAVLAADGKGTNVLTSMNGASFTIAATQTSPKPEVIQYVPPANTPGAPVVTSPVFTDFTRWYATTTAPLVWKLPSNVAAVRTLLDDQSGTVPTKVYDTPLDHLTLTDLHQGVQYFHIQYKNSDGWGKITTVRLAVDTEKPSRFDIALPKDADLSNPVQVLQLTVVDSGSGVDHYKVQIDGSDPFLASSTASSTLTLPKLAPGHHSVIIEAFDRAGNSLISTFAFDIQAFSQPKFTDYPSQLSADVILVIKGTTRPNSEVHVTIHKIGADTQTITVHSDDKGVFMYIPDSRLSLGVYELTAVAVDQYGAESAPSDTIRIAVQESGIVRIGNLAISILSVLIPLIALIVLLVGGMWYLRNRIRRLRRGVTKETDEALAMLAEQFERMHTELTAQTDALKASRKTKQLTKAEAALIDHMNSVITAAEKAVRKEVTDVEDIIE